jgi:hypothetical protein
MWWQLLLTMAPAIARGMGAAAAKGDYDEAERLRQQAINELNLPLPSLQDLTKELGPSRLEGVQADAQYTGAQNDALSGLKDLSQTGMSAQDRLGYNQAKLEAGNTYSGMMGRNAQLRAARGQVGSGADTADMMEAAQAGADRANRNDLQVASNAADRRYQALGAYGSMAERLRAADLAQKNRVAEAGDAIERFNNEKKTYGAQKYYGNALDAAKLKYGANRTLADDRIQRGEKTENTIADIGEGIQRAGSAYQSGQEYDDFLKKKYPGA